MTSDNDVDDPSVGAEPAPATTPAPAAPPGDSGPPLVSPLVASPPDEPTPPSFEELLELCNRRERRFVVEFMLDESPTKAVIRAGCFNNRRPDKKAYKLRQRPRVAAAIAAGLREIQTEAVKRALVSREEVVREWVNIGFADASELSELRVDSCRYCWGKGNRYQETPAERERRYVDYLRLAAEAQKKTDCDPSAIAAFDEMGGIGFTPKRAPNSDCPECFGDGVEKEIFHDTRGLSPGARALFAGIKRTREGLEVKTHSKEKALEMLGRHVGGFSEKHELSGPNGGPIETKRHADELSDAELESIARGGSPAPPGAEDASPLTDEELAAIVRGSELARSKTAPQEPDAGKVE